MESVECPICGRFFAKSVISEHADRCLDETDVDDEEIPSDASDSKRPRVEQEEQDHVKFTFSPPCSSNSALRNLTAPLVKTDLTSDSVVLLTDCASPQTTQSSGVRLSGDQSLGLNLQSSSVCATASRALKRSTKSTSLCDFFPGAQKSVKSKESTRSDRSSVKNTAGYPPASQLMNMQTTSAGNVSDTALCDVSTVNDSKPTAAALSHNSTQKQSAGAQSSAVLTHIPLAERMRPTTLADFVGQGHVIGSQRPLRSLLESASISSMILWGPPGCGKVTVSRLTYLR